MDVATLANSLYEIYFKVADWRIVYHGLYANERSRDTPNTLCVHIDEDIWVRKPDILLSRIQVQLGQAGKVHARDTVVARIDKRQALQFQEDHHLQVALPGKYRYGLFLQGELVSVAVFSGGRKKDTLPPKSRSFELLRFCHKKGLVVVGGLTKLIRSFEQAFHPGDLMTYVDRDWSDGHSYETLGFEKVSETAPQEFWVDPHTFRRYTVYDLSSESRDQTGAREEIGKLILKKNLGSLKLVKNFQP